MSSSSGPTDARSEARHSSSCAGRSRVGITTDNGRRSGTSILTKYPAKMSTLSASRALVTGGSGFIGSHLTRRLVAEGAEVHVVTSRGSSELPWRLRDLSGRISLHAANLVD